MERSRNDLSELYRLERLIAARDELTIAANAVKGECDALDDRSPPHLWTRLANQTDELRRKAELLQYSVRCENSLERCDAFLVIEASYGSALPHLKQLVEMYSAWTRRMGFDLTLVHEEMNREGSETGQVVLLIEGTAVYGVMQCEHGLHEFRQGRQENEYVLVSVMPVDETNNLNADGISVQSAPSESSGSIIGDFQGITTAAYKESDTVIRIENALDLAESERVAVDLLQSEIHHQATLEDGDPDEIEIARRYRLHTKALARDPRTGVTIDKLNDLWKGKLNPFFLGWLDR